ncbi:MAG: hypothetical protein Q9160_009033, partial [Pyrenula sp. 1 TL-2023]
MASGIYNPALAESAERGIELFFAPYLLSNSTKSKRLSESDVRHVSDGLYRMGRESWSRVPRIYAVLRIINQVQVIDAFITQGISDLWFPFSHKTLPECLRSPSSRFEFLDVQELVLTKALDLEREDGRHRYFSKTEEVPLRKIEELGKGGFGYVDRVISNITYKEYARKLIPRGRTFKKNVEVLKDFERELGHLKKLSHIHIVELIGSYTDTKFVGIIMSPVAEYNLKDFLVLDPLPPGSLSFLRSFFGCLAAALCYLHNNRIRHKDIKPQNVLVKGHQIFLTDFGISLDWSDLTQSTTSGPTIKTPRYCAPEVAENLPRNTFADVWSLGCVFLEIWTALKGEKIESLVSFLTGNGTKSTCYYSNCDTAVKWCKMLKAKTGTFEENPPFPWILGMLQPNQDERWTAQKLCDQIEEVNEDPEIRYTFSGLCCVHNDESSESLYSSKRSSMNLEETGATSIGGSGNLSKNLGKIIDASTIDLSSSQTVRPAKQLTPTTNGITEGASDPSAASDQLGTGDQRAGSPESLQPKAPLAVLSSSLVVLEEQPSLHGGKSSSSLVIDEWQREPGVKEVGSKFHEPQNLTTGESHEIARPSSSFGEQGPAEPVISIDLEAQAFSKNSSDEVSETRRSRWIPHDSNVATTESENELFTRAPPEEILSTIDVPSTSDQSAFQNENNLVPGTSHGHNDVLETPSSAYQESQGPQGIQTAFDQTQSSEYERVSSQSQNHDAESKANHQEQLTSLEDMGQSDEAIHSHHTQIHERSGTIATAPLQNGRDAQPDKTNSVLSPSKEDEYSMAPEQVELNERMEMKDQDPAGSPDLPGFSPKIHRAFSFEQSSEDLLPKISATDNAKRERVTSGSADVRDPGKVSPVQPPKSTRVKSTRTCGKCQEVLDGRFVRALDGTFHLECFTCQDCGVIVASKFFPVDHENGIDKVPLCETDYFHRLDLLFCGIRFGANDSYYEHEDQVLCNYHYTTMYALKCASCNEPMLKQFVEILQDGVRLSRHPECHLIYKTFGVKLSSTTSLPLENASDDATSQAPSLEERTKIEERQNDREQSTSRIWEVLSNFEEKAASKFSDISVHFRNGATVSTLHVAKGIVCYVSTLFSALDDLNEILIQSNVREMSFDRETKLLSKSLVEILGLCRIRNCDKGLTVDKKVLELVTDVVANFKLLIGIALRGAVRLEKETSRGDGLQDFLDTIANASEIAELPDVDSKLGDGQGELLSIQDGATGPSGQDVSTVEASRDATASLVSLQETSSNETGNPFSRVPQEGGEAKSTVKTPKPGMSPILQQPGQGPALDDIPRVPTLEAQRSLQSVRGKPINPSPTGVHNQSKSVGLLGPLLISRFSNPPHHRSTDNLGTADTTLSNSNKVRPEPEEGDRNDYGGLRSWPDTRDTITNKLASLSRGSYSLFAESTADEGNDPEDVHAHASNAGSARKVVDFFKK